MITLKLVKKMKVFILKMKRWTSTYNLSFRQLEVCVFDANKHFFCTQVIVLFSLYLLEALFHAKFSQRVTCPYKALSSREFNSMSNKRETRKSKKSESAPPA